MSAATGRWRRRTPLAAGRRSWAGAEPVTIEELEQNLLFFSNWRLQLALCSYSKSARFYINSFVFEFFKSASVSQ
jgi:hypothetical protein